MSVGKREVVGRRDRPAKGLLSRELIAETALQRLVEEGPEGLSLRKVAAALDTGPASLYVYVADFDELRALALDKALGSVKIAERQSGDWREGLKKTLTSYLLTLYGTPGLGQLAMAVIPTGPNAMRLLESLLGLLISGGVEGAKAAWGVDMLTLYCAALAAEQDLRRTRKQPYASIGRALAEADAHTFPLIHKLRHELTAGEGENRLSWALDTLIDGLVQAPNPLITDPKGGQNE